MSKNIQIIGAGFAGLIAGHMLRRFQPSILEASPRPLSNHSALLRFRSESVATATSIPFNRVRVRKGVKDQHGDGVSSIASIPQINAYSEKVSGVISDRSIVNLDPCDRWVAPDNFHELLTASCPAKINYGLTLNPLDIANKSKDHIIISTIPMPLLMAMVGWVSKEKFGCEPISTLVADIDAPLTTVYQTIYLPHKEVWGDFYRASIHGRQLILEGVGLNAQPSGGHGETDQQIARRILETLFGISRPLIKSVTRKVQKYGKMRAVSEIERHNFILYMTSQYNVYSLGRYATWRPILLDDVVQDVAVIERLMDSSYSRAKH